MILVLAVVAGLLVTIIRASLNKRKLEIPTLKQEWLVFAFVIPQIVVFFIPLTARNVPESIIPYIQIGSMLGLVVFCSLNIQRVGIRFLATGLISNLVVIGANNGWMPISPDTLNRLHPTLPSNYWIEGQRLAYTKDWIVSTEKTSLVYLSDIITVPSWISYKVAFSLGDIFIGLGVFFLLWSLSNGEKE